MNTATDRFRPIAVVRTVAKQSIAHCGFSPEEDLALLALLSNGIERKDGIKKGSLATPP
jgi:hypothetical protein